MTLCFINGDMFRLKQKGIATDIISESMGHQNLAVTQAYLKELESSVLDNACEMLL